MAEKNIMSYETVALDDEKSALVILDQTKLPYEVEILNLTEQKDIWNAIYLLQVRGAPAIGVAAGFGLNLPSSSSSGIILSSVLFSNSAFISSILLVSYFFSGSIFLYPFK